MGERMNDVMDIDLTRADVHNLMQMLRRGTFNGLEEAEIAVVLAHKLANAKSVPTIEA